MPEYRYRINSTAGKAGDKVTQTGERLRQLEERGIVQEVKVIEPETKSGQPKEEAKSKPKKSGKGKGGKK